MKKIFLELVNDVRFVAVNVGFFVLHLAQFCYQFIMSMIVVLTSTKRIKKGYHRRKIIGGIEVVIRPGFQRFGVLLWGAITIWISRILLPLLTIVAYMASSFLLNATVGVEAHYQLEGIIYDLSRIWKDWLISSTTTGQLMNANPDNIFQIALLISAIIGLVLYFCLLLNVVGQVWMVFFTRESKTVKVASNKVALLSEHKRRNSNNNTDVDDTSKVVNGN